METKHNYKTLLDKLSSLVAKEKIDDVTAIVAMLEKIHKLKYTVDNNVLLDTLLKKIAYELQVEFKVFDFVINYNDNQSTQNLICFGSKEQHNYTFLRQVDTDYTIIVSLYTHNQDELYLLSLNSYFEDMSTIIYFHHILENTNPINSDPLTKLKNRISLQEDIKILVPLALREKMNIGVLLINIDRFTAVNDEHGDQFGDQFLKKYAQVISNNIRSSDIAVRFGGGEFLVLLINVESEDQTIKLAHKLQDLLAQTYLLTPNNDQFKKTSSIGIAMFPQDSQDMYEVIKKAEIALSDARDKGRNQILKFVKKQESTIELF
ncbi:MAG: GGDEF domain-containing protein [Campylobacterales bacterium]|nr:GGDEF domain-containing protein [Campylobacterales bacterium]